MDYGRESGYAGGNVVHVLTGSQSNGGAENWGSGDQALWATEDDYGAWNRENSVDTNSNHDGRQSLSRSESDHLIKKSRTSQLGDSRSKAIGKMFFKTKLCCKFRAGTCPYVTNCNFAHSIEELRRPPPNWQEIVAAHDEERGVSLEPREEFQIPTVVSATYVDDNQRSYKGRHCKKYFSEEGCPYGDSCTFVHDEQSKARESVVISLGPGSGGSYGGNANASANANANANPNATAGASASNLKPSNWKTRICNKWELTGYCPFGTKCHFAHGIQELHRYGGGLVELEAADLKQQGTVSVRTAGDTVVASGPSHHDGYHSGVLPLQKLTNVIQRTVEAPPRKWKGPDKISRIYGDWIDDLE